MNTSLSILARALASENLSISFSNRAKTASFDIKNRHLVMPIWNVSDTLKTMLVAHEIAHALWTPQVESDRLFAEAEAEGYHPGFLHRICNTIEDVRIEKLMKDKYPGTRRDFFLGYKEIVENDMFKFSEMDFNRVGMMNRLNLHFKWGVPGFLTIGLHPDEQAVADEIDAVESFADVFALAKRLYEHPGVQEEKKKYMEQMIADKTAGSESGSGNPDDEEPGQGKNITQRIHNGEIIDLSTSFVTKDGNEWQAASLNIVPLTNYMDQVISTETLLNAYENLDPQHNPPLDIDGYRKFVKDSDSFVRQLVAQFERRKAADEIRKERPKQTGMLNLDRLHQYRTHDDIFLSKIVRQDGKNHGMMFMIDLSGSMGEVIGDCVQQVLQLVWFCEKAKIPFEVFGFTDGEWMGREKEVQEEFAAHQRNPDPNKGPFIFSRYAKYAVDRHNTMEFGDAKLFHMASSQDSASKRERLLAFFYESYVKRSRHRVIRLSNTPTVECLILISQIMQKWVLDNNIQIPTLMVVTDGEPNGVYAKNSHVASTFYNEETTLTVTNEITNTVHTCPGTQYGGMNMGNVIVGTILDGLRDTLNVRCIGMFVGPNTLTDHYFRQFCVSRKEWDDMHKGVRDGSYGYAARDSVSSSARCQEAKQTYKDSGSILIHDSIFPGYDGFFLIKANSKIVRDEDAIADSGTFSKIKNTFVKTMGKRSSSRVFLTKYVDIVAGQPIKTGQEPLYRMSFFNPEAGKR